ncbi:MAG TPA: CerR family C-terminal domain-containing protein [Planctomycetota bacterium]|nr:CerR family C-terminal domain-containing protein [Planctomycetota bacterium]
MHEQGGAETDTRQRVLESATRLFAEKGFRETTVHEICDAAHANIAAVNYHFGSKERLYDAAWRHAYQLTRESRDVVVDPDSARSPEEQIHAFIQARLDDVSSAEPASYFWRILEKEHHNPTPAHDAVIREVFRPLGQRLAQLIARLLGDRASEMQLRLCVFSLVGTIGFLTQHKQIVQRVFGHEALDRSDCAVLHEHLARFFFAGVRDARHALEEGRAAAPLTRASGGIEAAADKERSKA